MDGFINKFKSQRTLMVLVDFSRAFDAVWRIGLLKKLIQYKAPMCMIKWIKGILSDWSAKVRIENTDSKFF